MIRVLEKFDDIKNIILPTVLEEKGHVWHLFVILTENRSELEKYLEKNGIQTLIHYPIPIHKQQAYDEFNNLKLPITERIHNEILSLPMGMHVSREDLIAIVNIINSYKN